MFQLSLAVQLLTRYMNEDLLLILTRLAVKGYAMVIYCLDLFIYTLGVTIRVGRQDVGKIII